MVLLVSGSPLSGDSLALLSLLETGPLMARAQALLAAGQNPETVAASVRSLYVRQTEHAIALNEHADIIGASHATTCCITAIHNPRTRMGYVVHYDGIPLSLRDAALVSTLDDGMPLQLTMVGGFDDAQGASTEVAVALLAFLHALPVQFAVAAAVLCSRNNRRTHPVRRGDDGNRPILTSLALNLATGAVFPAAFEDEGPAPFQRHLLASGALQCVYDATSNTYRLAPVSTEGATWLARYAAQPDEFLLDNLSTSPFAEDAAFVPDLRAFMKFLQSAPKLLPALTLAATTTGWQPVP